MIFWIGFITAIALILGVIERRTGLVSDFGKWLVQVVSIL